ncbi:MAG: hypothetical protein JG782_898 [Anaerophaga sp.]|nr:hypothetical protein [Anaerophaga sp.]MDK2840616.1 hypothetical protein [Anaerophaga sp.]MDN5292209.1 hypothetical protein [Anaerophaga sp.]
MTINQRRCESYINKKLQFYMPVRYSAYRKYPETYSKLPGISVKKRK